MTMSIQEGGCVVLFTDSEEETARAISALGDHCLCQRGVVGSSQAEIITDLRSLVDAQELLARAA